MNNKKKDISNFFRNCYLLNLGGKEFCELFYSGINISDNIVLDVEVTKGKGRKVRLVVYITGRTTALDTTPMEFLISQPDSSIEFFDKAADDVLLYVSKIRLGAL
jgi:hypothetical protein